MNAPFVCLRPASVAALLGVLQAPPALPRPALALAPSRWFSAGALVGSTLFDRHFSDFQWDTAPRPAFGAEALAGVGRAAVGIRVWRAGAAQHLNTADVADPAVHATTFELVGEARVATVAGLDVLARGHGGQLRLGYAPDHATIDAGGSPVEVTFAPVHEWTGGAGIAVRRGSARRWNAGLKIERQAFRMDTAHRSGSATVLAREGFGDWNVRLMVARVFAGRPEGSE